MRPGALVRSALIFGPLLLVCAARAHAQHAASPDGMTRELHRCLTVLRVASARRRMANEQHDRLVAGVRGDGAAAFLRPRPRRSRTA